MGKGLRRGDKTNRRHRKGRRGLSATLVVAVLAAFALGWLVATVLAGTARRGPGATPPPPSAPPSASSANSPGPPRPVGFAQPTMAATGLELIPVLTKVHGGVLVTVVAQNRSDQPITVQTTNLGPHDVAFRGAPVDTQMTGQTKRLVPGEALVYSCRVSLPDMNSGQLSLVVAGIPVSGPAAGD